MTDNDVRQIRELTDALRDLERTLNSSITKELEAITRSLAGMAGNARAPISALDTLRGTLMDFAALSGVPLAILGVKEQLAALGGPKIAGIAAIIGAISIAVNGLVRAFGNATPAAAEFAAALADGSAGLDTQRQRLERLLELYRRQSGLEVDLTTAGNDYFELASAHWNDLDFDAIDIAAERLEALQKEAREARVQMRVLREELGVFGEANVAAALNIAIIEEAIDSASIAVGRLIDAYDAAFDSAYRSITSTIGLFGRLDFESEKTAGSMVDTWRGQAEDFEAHQKVMAQAAAMGMAPEVIAAFSDVNRAGEFRELILGIANGCESMEGMGDTAQERMQTVNDAFANADLGAQDLASAIAKIKVDFDSGMAEIVAVFEHHVAQLDLTDECREHGRAAIAPNPYPKCRKVCDILGSC